MPRSFACRGDRQAHRLALEIDLALIELEAARQRLDERRLAGTVVADQPDDLAGTDVEVGAVQRADVAEAARDGARLQQCGHAVPSCCVGGWRALRWPGGARSADEQPDVAIDVPIAASRGDDEGLAAFDVDGLAVHRRQRAGAGQHHGDGESGGHVDARRQKFHAEEGRCLLRQHLHQAATWAPMCRVSAATSVSAAAVWTTDSATSRGRPRKTSSSDAVVLVRSNRID